MDSFKYFAFISYSSHDLAWGRHLQRKLESYRMPATLCSERGWRRKPLNPIFFAPTDIQPGGLSQELQERLRQSRHLIVICSPHSAQSEWVGREIAFFHELGRTENIHFFIVEGTPHSGNPDTECFNPVIEQLGIPEILGANIHEQNYRWPFLNRERAYVQLITKLLGIEFDSIWQRHKRRMAQQLLLAFMLLAGIAVVVWQTWRMSQPVTVQIELAEDNMPVASLPPMAGGIVTLYLENETKTDTCANDSQVVSLQNIPQSMLGERVRVEVKCRDFLPLDTVVLLKRSQQLRIQRDPTVYGQIDFTLWSISREMPVPNMAVTVGGIETRSDAEGRVRLNIPLQQQRTAYEVTSAAPLADSMLCMPHTESAIIKMR